MIMKPGTVKTWIIAFILMVFFFIVPLQCFIIGDNLGMGVQGAVFRYQMTDQGNSLIPIPSEIWYITSGIYQGKTAVSVILWALGTLILACTTILSLVYWNNISCRVLGFIMIGITGSCMLFIASCIVRYGPLFSAPSGTSLPLGIIILAMFAGFLYFYQDLFIEKNAGS